MKQNDYFQPMGQRDKIQYEPGLLQKSLQESWGVWVLWGLILYFGPTILYALIAYDYKREIHRNLGHGVIPMCSHKDTWDDYECKQCPKELHDHYSKAWRKVK